MEYGPYVIAIAVRPKTIEGALRLMTALAQLAEQDPAPGYRHGSEGDWIIVEGNATGIFPCTSWPRKWVPSRGNFLGLAPRIFEHVGKIFASVCPSWGWWRSARRCDGTTLGGCPRGSAGAFSADPAGKFPNDFKAAFLSKMQSSRAKPA